MIVLVALLLKLRNQIRMLEKVVGEGVKVTSVPVLSVFPTTLSLFLGFPSEYACS